MAHTAETGTRLVNRARSVSARTRRARASGAALVPSKMRQFLTGAASTVGKVAKTAVTTTIAAAPKGAGFAARIPGIAGFLAPVLIPLAIGSLVENRRRGKATRETLARLRTPEGRTADIQRRVFMKTLQDNLLSSRLARMKRVARNDPAIFKMLAAMVVGSARPRTNARTVRIGRDPSQAEMISSGLFG